MTSRVALAVSAALATVGAAQDLDFFEARVRPVLAKNCYACHGSDKQFAALRVDSREALLTGGKRGPAIVAGKPEASLLLKAVRHDGLRMPMGGKLKDSEIAAIEEWIRKGAPWPVVSAASDPEDRYRKLAREHWAFQPVSKSAPPEVHNAAWKRNPIDRFLLAALHKTGLSPAPPAGKRTLIRRLSYVLTGLPPSAAEVDRYLSDSDTGDYARLVDRLLTSPRFGEHWARHWLDLVRYGETRGYEWNYEIIGAWRYRDYLIRAFNSDVPYDQLVREHIAGDLLPNPRINGEEKINESVIGTTFYRLGEAGHDDCIRFREIALDVVDNQIDTLTKTFQGLTVSCARCHNHKLDPVPIQDYYGLYGILNSSRQVTHTIDSGEVNAQAVARLGEIKRQIRSELARQWKRESRDVARYLLATLPSHQADGLDPARADSWKKVLERPSQKLEDPAYAWSAMACETGYNREYFGEAARSLAARYEGETRDRVAFNQANFEPFGNLRSADFGGWHASGMGLRQGPGSNGEFTVAPEGEAAVDGIFPAGVFTHLISGRLNGALRSPYLPKNKKFLSVRAMGGSLGARRTVIDNCSIGENYKVLENPSPAWVKLDTFANQDHLPVFVELVTRWDNPRIPDRPGVLKKPNLKLMDAPRSFFGITQAVLHDVDETPREELSHIRRLFEKGTPSGWEDLAARYGEAIEQAVESWAAGKAGEEDVRWLDWLVRNKLLSNRADANPRLNDLTGQYRALESRISPPRVVEGLADIGPGRDFPLLIGGDAKSLGPKAPRQFLKHLFPESEVRGAGSGRSDLADLIASPSNPLTARVMVNRIWQHVFGRGIVASVDNFGLIGDPPSHPELLDYLAATFVEQGWSLKRMIRLMVLAEAFQQSGHVSGKAREADPQNALLHHYPLRRLSAEALRDSILLTSGNLKDSLYGPSVHPHRAEAKDYRRLFSGPLDGEGRRSIYLKVTRMEGTRFLDTFDYPIPMVTRGSRDVTNVPAQALALLNDPFVLEQAEALAVRLLAGSAGSVEARIEELFRSALSRKPGETERERFRGLALELSSLHQVPRERILESREVWKDLAHAVLNLKEFIYIQ
ncbi:MAG: PSD1 and planctomycete cytochrome C domain-containing protein [Bryobacteraceae bacterium]